MPTWRSVLPTVTVARSEQFRVSLNGQPCKLGPQALRYAANGRDTRLHTVMLGPYLEVDIALSPAQLRQGENVLEVTPTRLLPGLTTAIRLAEIELRVAYGQG